MDKISRGMLGWSVVVPVSGRWFDAWDEIVEFGRRRSSF